MATLLLSRVLEIALHFAILGGLADVALQLHGGQVREAITHAVIASICIVVFAGASYVAKNILGKHHDDVQLDVTCVLKTKKPRADTSRRASRSTRNRKSQ